MHCSNANHDVFEEEEGDRTPTDAKKAQVVYPRNQNYEKHGDIIGQLT